MASRPMSAAEFRAVRNGLGLDAAELARRWDINVRTIERYEAGKSAVADVWADALRMLELEAADEVAEQVATLTEQPMPEGLPPALYIGDGDQPMGWQRAIAFRVRTQLAQRGQYLLILSAGE